MSQQSDLLVEIGTEELPPKALSNLSQVFGRGIIEGLDKQNLTHGEVLIFATPRRLAVKIHDVAMSQPDQTIERRGPAVSAAFDAAGEPTKAAMGFAKSCNVAVDRLARLKTDKGEWLSYSAEVAGKNTVALVPEIIERALSDLPIPKPMRWGDNPTEFVRPVHWVVMLFGDEIVKASILGVVSGRITRGHRFHSTGEITLDSSDDYPERLENGGFVITDFDRRRGLIVELATKIAAENGGSAVIDEGLLDEVTALVEWPIPIIGSFDEHFLQLPREVLVKSMQDHQKYFPVEATDGSLVNKFITISNIDSSDPAAVRSGNERVIRPRLSDAAFFWDQDRKTRLEQGHARLADVIFEKELGSLKDKTDRVVRLSETLASKFGAEPSVCSRIAYLSRCDLISDMVGEFPELQGVMGSYYAAADGESTDVAKALGEFYMPRFAGDMIPTSAAARCVAYADKLDTLVGIFAIGSAPTGDKDPYALRRAALGCIRIALEADVSIGFSASLDDACAGFASVIATENAVADVFAFLTDRLRSYFTDRDVPISNLEAVLASNPDEPVDIRRRIEAVEAFQKLPQAATLAAANKRIANILRKNGVERTGSIDTSLFEDAAERILMTEIDAISKRLEEQIRTHDYAAYLTTLVQLHDPINAFFDDVMVMCDDQRVRGNRIALLHHIHSLFTAVADIARLNE